MITAQSFLTLLSLLSTLSLHISAKKCTNGMTDNFQFHSHTLRSQHNSHLNKHIITEFTEFSSPLTTQRKLLHNNANSAVYENRNAAFLSEVSLHDVRLDRDSMYGQAQQTNLEYLLMLDVDRLVWSFRKLTGVFAAGNPYGGWEGPEVELRGHFVGHYLSASAQMWASTHNDTIYRQMSLVVDALQECQRTIGTGYLSAFPSELFDRIEALDFAWAPYYTIHKIMAGLLDQHLLANSDKALKMVVWMAEYIVSRVKNVIQLYSIERHWMSLNEETGGMNDVLYRLYSVTNDKKHLMLAHLFDKPCFLGLLAVEADSLSEFHSNTHIPVVVGAQMRYEVTGDPLYKEVSMFFMDSVNSSHSYATGGTSVGEYWTDPKRLADKLSTETQESCTTYNMLKVSRNLFRWTKEMAYADYYERALMNGVLSIQRGRDPGVMIYMLPLGPGQSKAHSYHGWGTQFDSFWCCYGTGIESFSKLGDSIYFEDKSSVPSLYIIQYIPSSFSWSSGGITLRQTTEPVISSDPFLRVTVEVLAYELTNQPSTLNLRIPSWTSTDEMEVTLNSQLLQLPNPGSFLSLTKAWTSKEILTFKMPIVLRTEAIKDDRPKYSSIQAILFGPYLLAGLTSGDWDIKTGNSSSITDWIIPIPPSYHSQLISLTQDLNNQTFVLSNSDSSLKMENWPKEGTNSALHGTFRIFTQDFKEVEHIMNGKMSGQTSVMLEPFHLPGKAVGHQGPHKGLTVTSSSQSDTLFKLVGGLDGKLGTVSLESSSHPGCFVSSSFYYSAGQRVQLNCMVDLVPDMMFQSAASFSLIAGVRQYNPISFLAKGARQDFILEPLLSLKDENYTAYFNIQA